MCSSDLTKPPVGDVEPVKDLKVKMHRKVGKFAVAAWRYTVRRPFVVEFQTNVDATWVRVDESRLYHDETDGMFYPVCKSTSELGRRGQT